MKKRIITILMVAAVMSTMLTGCISEESNEVTNMIASLEARHEAGPGVYSPEEEEKTSVDLRKQLGMDADKEQEDQETVQESESESGDADKGQSGENVASDEGTDADAGENGEEKDWSKAYDGYFQREDTQPEMAKVTMYANGEGLSMTVVAAVAEDVILMSFECGEAEIDMYMTNEKMYAYTTLDGSSKWTYTRIASEEEAESMMSMGEMARITDDWNGIKRYTYRSAIESDGITYDTLNVIVEDEYGTCPCVFYVNRETQMVDRYTCVRDGMNMDCYMTEAEPFTLPEQADRAKEVGMEDIATDMMAVIMAGYQG